MDHATLWRAHRGKEFSWIVAFSRAENRWKVVTGKRVKSKEMEKQIGEDDADRMKYVHEELRTILP